MTTVHVLPLDDIKEHTESVDCECKPTIRYVNTGKVVIHNAWDKREYLERWEEESPPVADATSPQIPFGIFRGRGTQ